MIRRIEALNYRSLRYVSQALCPFQLLIGPNASGKSTFLDVVAGPPNPHRRKRTVLASGPVTAKSANGPAPPVSAP